MLKKLNHLCWNIPAFFFFLVDSYNLEQHDFNYLTVFVLNIGRSSSTAAAEPEKIEVFVNDQSVHVYPGVTVLQVSEPMQIQTKDVSLRTDHATVWPELYSPLWCWVI